MTSGSLRVFSVLGSTLDTPSRVSPRSFLQYFTHFLSEGELGFGGLCRGVQENVVYLGDDPRYCFRAVQFLVRQWIHDLAVRNWTWTFFPHLLFLAVTLSVCLSFEELLVFGFF